MESWLDIGIRRRSRKLPCDQSQSRCDLATGRKSQSRLVYTSEEEEEEEEEEESVEEEKNKWALK